MTATLPAALLVILWWQRGRLSWRRDWRPLIPWLAIGAGWGLFSAWVEHTYVGAQGAKFGLTALERCLVAGRAIWFYLGKLLWPADLVFIYPRWNVGGSQFWPCLFPLGVMAAVAALWLIRKRRRAPLAAALFFIGSLFPVLGFFNVYAFVYSFVADHWAYLPSLGVIALVAGGVGRAAGGKTAAAGEGRMSWDFSPPLIAYRLLPAAVVGILGILTFRQCARYNDMETFYRSILAENPSSWMAQNNLGNLLRADGRTAEAISHYEAGLAIDPRLPEVQYNLGAALADAGRFPDAISHYRRALAVAPNYTAARYNLGVALAESGHLSEAIAEYRAALRLDPVLPGVRAHLAVAHNNLGVGLFETGAVMEAISHYRAALSFDPNFAEAHCNLGRALDAQGERADALAEFHRALELKPDYPVAEYDLGVALAAAGRAREAIGPYEAALRLKPDYPEAESNLGAALAMTGRPAEAVPHYERAIRLSPGLASAHYNLGLALRSLGRSREAAAQFAAAARLNREK